jgi:hypothetical protein
MVLSSPDLNSTNLSSTSSQTTLNGNRAINTGIIAAYIVAGFVVGCMLGSIFYCLWPSRARRRTRAQLIRERDHRVLGVTVSVLPL